MSLVDHMDQSGLVRLIDVSLQELDFQLSKGRRSLLVAKKQKYLRTVTGSLLYQVSLLLGVIIIKGHFTTNHSMMWHSVAFLMTTKKPLRENNFPLCSRLIMTACLVMTFLNFQDCGHLLDPFMGLIGRRYQCHRASRRRSRLWLWRLCRPRCTNGTELHWWLLDSFAWQDPDFYGWSRGNDLHGASKASLGSVQIPHRSSGIQILCSIKMRKE